MRQILYLLLFTLSLASCEKFLQVDPKQQVDQSQSITDQGSVETAVNGMYHLLGSNSYYGSNFPALSYLSAGDIQWSGSQAAPQQITLHKITADNSYVSNAWGAIYQTILSANTIITKVPEVEDPLFTDSLRNQYVGEAHFVRALCYFDLVRGWGGVQLILTPTNNPHDHQGIKRSSKEETYAQVLKDLHEAERLLPLATDRNRATRKSAWGVLSRYFLYQKNWDSAAYFATKLIDDDKNYQLLKPYSAFFANNATGTAESVFEIHYSISSTNGESNWWLPPALGGRREWSPNNKLVSLLNDPAVGGNRNALIAQTAPPGNLWYGKLYYRTPTGTDPAYILRMSELYLIRSEAYVQKNRLEDALADVNAVRDRAGTPPLAAGSSARQILEDIQLQRRLEFPFESDRWFDLVRTGQVAAVLGITDPRKYVFPIPTSELLADKNLEQNDGY